MAEKSICIVDIVLLESLINKIIVDKHGLLPIKIAYSYIPIHNEWILFVSGLNAVNEKVDPPASGKMADMQALAKKFAAKYFDHFRGA